MRFLILGGDFSLDGTNTWLLEDLADALVDEGHVVDVIARGSTTGRPRGLQPQRRTGLRVFNVGVRNSPRSSFHRRLQAPASIFRLRTAGAKWAREQRYDAAIFSSGAWGKMRLPQYLKRVGDVRYVVLIYWDFFPTHHFQIGQLPAYLRFTLPILKLMEKASISGTDILAVMTPRNRKYFQSYFGFLPRSVITVPPWGRDVGAGPTSSGREEFTAVFGGQLTVGRGFEDLLDAAAILEERGSSVQIRIFGDGPLRDHLRKEIDSRALENVFLMGRVPREEYLHAIKDADAGIAATVQGVSVPTFPSKLVDYASVGLPIVISTETAGDVGQVVSHAGAGIAVKAGDPQELADSLLFLADPRHECERREMSMKSRGWFEGSLSAAVAAQRIARAVQEESAPSVGQG